MPQTPRLKNTLALVALAPGASIVLTHELSNGQRDLAPDIIFLPNEGLVVTLSDTTAITVQNDGLAPISGAILVEAWHTIERAFGDVANEDLPVKPYIVVSDAADDDDRNPMALPEQWIIENVGDSGAVFPPEPMLAQVSTNFDEVQAIRAGSIVGIRARVVEELVSGTITALATINGVPQPLTAIILTGQTNDGSRENPGVIPYIAGDLIGVAYSCSDGLSPSDTTMEAWLEVFEVIEPV